MHCYTDAKYHCPFYPEHIIPLNSVNYHCNKCEVKYLTEKPGRQVFHCKHNYMHIFLKQEQWQAHQSSAVCKKDVTTQVLQPFVPKPDEKPQRPKARKYVSAKPLAASSALNANKSAAEPPKAKVEEEIKVAAPESEP